MSTRVRDRIVGDPHMNNDVVVYGGEYKGCRGVYKDGNEAMVRVQLEAKLIAGEVWIPREYVWDK